MLRGHCQAFGRAINEITVSTSIQNIYLLRDGEDPNTLPAWVKGVLSPDVYRQNTQAMTVDQLAANVEAVVAAGANYVIVYLAGLAYDQDPMRRFAQEIMPRFA